MAHWIFPDHSFTLETKDGTYTECRLVLEDSDEEGLYIIDHVSPNRMKSRRQMLKENIVGIYYPSPASTEQQVDSLLRSTVT